VVQDTLRRAAGLIFNSRPERDLANRLIGDLPRHRVVGAGFDDPGGIDAAGFRRRQRIDGDVITYAGRRELGKNFPLLLEYVALYGQALSRRGSATLVTMGSGSVDAPDAARRFVVDLGFVTRREMLDAIAASVATTLLSLNESFSFFIGEGWICGVPAIVHAECAVTRQHCEDSGGGLWVRSAEEFAEALDRLRGDHELRRRMGEAGRAWILGQYSWTAVLDRLEDAVVNLLA
jgi:glycosyltransferase involved in cell wall biosynthesis